MPKERNFNPVQAQRKADKAKAIKKGKAEVQSRRNERLAQRNPDRIQQQIDGLKAITEGGGKLTRHEAQTLEGLEKEFRAVTKAREALGDKAPTFAPRRDRDRDGEAWNSTLGKRRRHDGDIPSSEDDVPDDVKSIPMPRDTPPPIPKEFLDKWYEKRRARRNAENAAANGEDQQQQPPPASPQEPKTVYEAKPVVRDLRKEAVSAFVPAAVRMKVNRTKAQDGPVELGEPEQVGTSGYMKSPESVEPAPHPGLHRVTIEDVDE